MAAEGEPPIWTPAAAAVAETGLARFARFLAERGVDATGYEALHRFSIEQPEAFWSAVWDFCGVIGDPGPTVVDPHPDMWRTRFFPEARLNVAQNLLRRSDEAPAIVWQAEDRLGGEVSWAELHHRVSRLQQALVAAGVGAGDRVAAWLPNMPDTYAVMLAAASIGAVFSSGSPDFGVDGVVDRFGQIEPKVLFATDAYAYGGVTHDCLERLAAIRERLPSVETVVVVPFLEPEADTGGCRGATTLDDFVAPHPATEVRFEPLPFDHPWYVLFSSGTTGAPKCIVHRAGGVLIQHLKEHRLHCDVRLGDRVFYFTTAGWMMWNWLASALASEAAIVVYDGSPFHPGPDALFDLAEATGTALFGTSAKFVEAVGKAGVRPVETHDLSRLRTITSTGSPLSPEGFDTVYSDIAPEVHLASISGGTDLCACLVGGDPTGPVWRGEIQRPSLGLDIDVVDDDGRSLAPGDRGELVCRNPFPSTPLGFWNDPGDLRYRAAYFDRIPGVWHQGDYAERTPHGGFVIHGRSDATLNPGGVRIGTAEIYRQVDAVDEVLESVAIGQDWEGDTRIVLFVRLRDGEVLTDELVEQIRDRVRRRASPRHVPGVVLAVDDIPRTRSGKLSELAVRDAVHGRDIANTEALANPEALDQFRHRPELGLSP